MTWLTMYMVGYGAVGQRKEEGKGRTAGPRSAVGGTGLRGPR